MTQTNRKFSRLLDLWSVSVKCKKYFSSHRPLCSNWSLLIIVGEISFKIIIYIELELKYDRYVTFNHYQINAKKRLLDRYSEATSKSCLMKLGTNNKKPTGPVPTSRKPKRGKT